MRILPVLLVRPGPAVLAACGSDNDTHHRHGHRRHHRGGGNNRLTLGVNSYLWHATLDTLSFMPLHSADPFGGVIITDWYVAPTSPG